VNFYGYLTQIKNKALVEKNILDKLTKKENLDEIEIRAAKSSLQVLIEIAIGKAKKILKHYNCGIIPQRSKDAVFILYEVGAIEEECYSNLIKAIGFRNIMIHDYLEFDDNYIISLLANKLYNKIYDFIVDEANYTDVIIKRIENFSF